MNKMIMIRGGGDLATGIAHRLHRSGFAVVITEISQPTVIRRSVSFADAVFAGEVTVEGITGRLSNYQEVESFLAKGIIPVLIDPDGDYLTKLKPDGVVDAIIAKVNTGTALRDAPVVIGVGPGFTAGEDVHAVVETARGHNLGRVYLQGSAIPNTGIPGDIGGHTIERLIRSPGDGILQSCCTIGDIVALGDTVAIVDGKPAQAAMSGMIRGILQDGLTVFKGMKIGDIDARCELEHCFTISDKARAIGGGVLEGLLYLGGRVWR